MAVTEPFPVHLAPPKPQSGQLVDAAARADQFDAGKEQGRRQRRLEILASTAHTCELAGRSFGGWNPAPGQSPIMTRLLSGSST
ncbi:hypothetical protein HYQ46_013084 [Verticillium longisporum]|nr:hypothetical protein HYQ46_013084 [Verticillium longisporum]